MPTLATFIQQTIVVLATAIRQEKEIKDIQIGKEEVKRSLFADDTILYKENPRKSHQKTIRINEFSKVAGKKSMFRNLLRFYTLTMNYQKESENNPIYNCIKKNKIPKE